MNNRCSGGKDGLQWSDAHEKWKPELWKSVKLYHWADPFSVGHGEDNGIMDYCRFWPGKNCDGDFFTDCQGHCNLKNIGPKMGSFRCQWNTTYYPS